MALEALSSEEVAEDVLLAALLRPEEVEGVELWLCLSKDGGLHPEGRVGAVELNPGQLGSLDVGAELGRGVQSALRVPVQSEAGLSSDADTVDVSIVEPSGHEASDGPVLTAASVELEAAGEGGAHAVPAVTHLCGDAKLRHNLAVGVDGSSEAGPEGQVAVLLEETISTGKGGHAAETSAGGEVLDSLVRVDVDRWCRAKASKDLLGGTLVLRDVVEAEEAARASVLTLSRSRLPALDLLLLRLLLLLLRPLVAELLRLGLLGLTELLLRLLVAELLLLRLRTAEAQEPCVGGSSSRSSWSSWSSSWSSSC